MLICQRNSDLQPDLTSQQEFDWSQPAKAYTNLEEMPSFISRHQVSAPQHTFTTTAEPQNLQGKQLQAYTIVRQHLEADSPTPTQDDLRNSWDWEVLLD